MLQKTTLGDMLLDERLSLTLDEIVHIRSVLTKAELESLPVEGRVKEDVEKRRVCFLCLKTRFGLLGPWGQRCRLCKRTVCVKCYSKVSIFVYIDQYTFPIKIIQTIDEFMWFYHNYIQYTTKIKRM